MIFKAVTQNFNRLWLIEIIKAYEFEHPAPVLKADDLARLNVKETDSTDEFLAKYSQAKLTAYGLATGLNQFKVSLKRVVVCFFVLAIVVGICFAQGLPTSEVIQGEKSAKLNLPWLISAFLGLHFITYIFWLMAQFMGLRFNFKKHKVADQAHVYQGLLGRTAHWVIAILKPRAQQEKGASYDYSWRAFRLTLVHYQLEKGLYSCLHHAYWFVLLSVGLLWLTLLFLFKEYEFIWESTILSEQQLLFFIHYLNIGLAQPLHTFPDLMAESNAVLGRWLLLALFVYGVGLRFVSFIGVAISVYFKVSKAKYSHLSTGFEALIAQRKQLERQYRIGAQVVDHDRAIHTQSNLEQPIAEAEGDYYLELEHAHLSIELQTYFKNAPIQPLGVVASLSNLPSLADIFKRKIAQRLWIAVDTNLTPDRANLALLDELILYSQQSFILLSPATGYFYSSWLEVLTHKQHEISQQQTTLSFKFGTADEILTVLERS